MLWLNIFEGFYSIVAGISSVVLPAIPQPILSAFQYLLNAISDGLHVLFYIFLDADIITALAPWILTVWAALFALDIAWMIVGYIKLSRKN